MFRYLTLALLLAVFVSACGGKEVDGADRSFSEDELRAIAAPDEGIGERYGDIEFSEEDSGVKTNEELIDDADDPDDEREDQQRFGRVTGYEGTYMSMQAAQQQEGVFMIGTGVDLLERASDCAGYMEDGIKEAKDESGVTDEDGWTTGQVSEFDPDEIGESTRGITFTLDGKGAQDNRVTIHSSMVVFCRGRLLGVSMLFRLDDEGTQQDAMSLARELNARIDAAVESGAD